MRTAVIVCAVLAFGKRASIPYNLTYSFQYYKLSYFQKYFSAKKFETQIISIILYIVWVFFPSFLN